jgi:uncharacterized protein
MIGVEEKMQKILIDSLQHPELYPHPVKYFRLIETHISSVILTGDYAYKIKKPLNMEFLDFSTLEKRHHFCQEELRINKNYALDLYLEVIAITGSNEQPHLNGKGDIIEYAIKMREFSQDNLFGQLLQEEKLMQQHFIQLAEQLARIHRHAAIADVSSHFGTPEQLFFPVQQNFDQIRPLLKNPEDFVQLEKCEQWAQFQHKKHYHDFIQRHAQGFVRECHGDLHLRNIVLYHNKPLIFDAIEFNPDLQWTDVMGDVGFLTMDLLEKNHPEFAISFLNHYLTLSGDYSALQILRFYQAYRAVVRAKIYIMQYQQNADPALLDNYHRSIKIAENFTESKPQTLIIMHGIAGSGKTTRARVLAEQFYAIHLRSDVERKRLFSKDFYTEDNMQKVYEYLFKLCDDILQNGYSVIVDASFLKHAQREHFRSLAEKMKCAFFIANCVVDEETRSKRLSQRPKEYSDADVVVARKQKAMLEPLTLEESQKIL